MEFSGETDEKMGWATVMVTLSFNAKMDLANFECNLNDVGT